MTLPSSFDLDFQRFSSLGDYAEAGLVATELALKRAERSSKQGRIPISGAAVELLPGGKLKTVIVGNNGRIPVPHTHDIGYPTDHGETGAIRQIKNVGKVHWDRVVFATTLSPCIMCGRTLQYLHSLGLRRITVAEAKSFPGTIGMLKKLPGMQVVELTNKKGIAMMELFARTYPWDWAADIGEVPPDSQKLRQLNSWLANKKAVRAIVSQILTKEKIAVAVVDCTGKVVVKSNDGRTKHGNNPCHSAVMKALGSAGSSVNLRECALVFVNPGGLSVNLETFGHSSLGACELFRPAAIVSNQVMESSLSKLLQKVGIQVIAMKN